MCSALLKYCSSFLFVFLLTTTAHAVDYSGPYSTELTGANLLEKTSSKVFFVVFYAPWCGTKCIHMQNTWRELGPRFQHVKGAALGHMDCTLNHETCKKLEIQAYPTLALVYSGAVQKHYLGPRDPEAMEAFVLHMAGQYTAATGGEAAHAW
mmetsp:Transcript_12602/g.27237  ORF Transcript_12602/g.27237 Transcript_12602/m.27237 type:complete len:152 (+) Transcript_12602:32-487(+)